MTKVEAHFTDIRSHILNILNEASSSIKICMAWLTQKDLMNMLIQKLDEGLNVHICLLDDKSNRKPNTPAANSLDNLEHYWADLKTFQRKCGRLNIVPTHLGYIHHKFAIIDDNITITGSYNWSGKAESNKENIVVIYDEEVANKFTSHLEEIVQTNHSYIIETNFDQCNKVGCIGRLLHVRIADHRETSKYGENEVYRLAICTENIEEHTVRVSGETKIDFIGDLIEKEIEDLDNEGSDQHAIYDRRIESRIAWALDSREDVFVESDSHDVLGAYNIQNDLDGYPELKAIWEHDLIKPFSVRGREDEIIDIVDRL